MLPTRDTPKRPFAPTFEQKIALLEDSVRYEMIFAFGVSGHDETDYCAWEHVNYARMGHARALYDFFETPVARRKQDDATCEDYDFPARLIARPDDDRKRLNKQLFHITYDRLRFNETAKPWPHTILSCLHSRCTEFLQHLLSEGSSYVAIERRPQWQALLDHLISGKELLIQRTFLTSGVETEYRIVRGQILPSGCSELTRPCPVA